MHYFIAWVMFIKALGVSQSIIQLKLIVKNGLRRMLRTHFNPRLKYHTQGYKTRKYHQKEQSIQNI